MSVRDRKKNRAVDERDRASAQRAGSESIAALGPSGAKKTRWRSFVVAAPKYLAPVAATFVMTLPLFAPWSVWPLAYLAFVPWLALACLAGSAAGVYVASYLLGAAFFFTHWRWLFVTTEPGYFAGSIAFALYFPLAAWMVRHLRMRRGIPVTFAFPVAWILVEMMRSRGPLAFPWFLLGHTQFRLLSLVQIADITGVYGVSFAVAMVNGLIVDLWIRKRRSADCSLPGISHASRWWPGAPVAVVCVLASLFGYGWYRLSTLSITPGPTAAVLQGDHLLFAEAPYDRNGDARKQATYFKLLREALHRQPDLVVMPETPWGMYLNRELREMDPQLLEEMKPEARSYWMQFVRDARAWHGYFSGLAHRERTTIVVGAISMEKQAKGVYPSELRYNSAFVFPPDASEPGRYDKINIVLFGEYVPFRYTLPSIYRWLNDNMTPFGEGGFEYSLTPGDNYRVFPLRERAGDGRSHEFGVTICYEDVIPQVFRRFILDGSGKKRVGFMLNISNDGWFGHGAQQAQHLVNCAFRAIENRVGVARSVNTGISGFVRPDGSWHDLVGNDVNWPTAGGIGYQVARIDCSPAVTFYSRFGDLFGGGIALLGCAVVIDAIISRRREKRQARQGQFAHV